MSYYSCEMEEQGTPPESHSPLLDIPVAPDLVTPAEQRLAALATVLAENIGRCGETNLGFEDSEIPQRPASADHHRLRPKSLNVEPTFSRAQKMRATLGALPRRLARQVSEDVPSIFHRANRRSWSSHMSGGSQNSDPQRQSLTSSPDTDEEIDWSWVAEEFMLASAENDAAEPVPVVTEAEPVVTEAVTLENAVPVSEEPVSPSRWSRASMRLARRLQLGDPPPPPNARTFSAPPGSLPPLPPLVNDNLDVVVAAASPVRRPASAQEFPRRYSTQPEGSRATIDLTATTTTATTSTSTSTSTESTNADTVASSSLQNSRRRLYERLMFWRRHQNSSDSSNDEQQTTDSNGSGDESCEEESPLGYWPHNLSPMLASLGCTLGLCNINRFAMLSIDFGANFILQFLFMSLVFGVPLYAFHVSLGQFLVAGVVDMWRISPVFQGIGIALLVCQALLGIYSIVGVSWMFTYFRDSFITKVDRYRWAEPYEFYREDSRPSNGSFKLEETVPDYLNGVVLQRHDLGSRESSFGHLKFQVTFNLAVVWMIVFVSLSKGLKSYGKVVYLFSLVPVFTMLVLCTKLLGLTPASTSHEVFPETDWGEFFLNTRCWVAATTEAFFTWGLLGAAAMQIASHNKNKHLLNRDTGLVIVLTLAVLILAAFLANTCVQVLRSGGYTYLSSSFERMSTYTFLRPEGGVLPHHYTTTPVRFMTHSQFVLGSRIMQPGAETEKESGYQVLKLATELIPATLAYLGADQVSPFWAVLFFFTLILFGIAQQLAIWHCVITGIMAINVKSLKSWETTITFFSCACGFVLGLPMTTELGIFVVFFMDYVVGGVWWIMVLYLLEIIAVLVVRGRPYSGDLVVNALLGKGSGCLSHWAAPMLVFNWNVILPVGLMVLCITIFKDGKFKDLYSWQHIGIHYWPLWAREIGCFIQLLPILAVPFAAVVQSCRYLSSGPPDLFDRIAQLYRPPPEPLLPIDDSQVHTTTAATNTAPNTRIGTATPETVVEDPPPKYTPPPSYTTATGARIAKMLRQSFRRSVRRIATVLGEQSDNPSGATLPPNYDAVLVEINRSMEGGNSNTLEVPVPSAPPATPSPRPNRMSTLTASQVAQILRSSTRRAARQQVNITPPTVNETKLEHSVT